MAKAKAKPRGANKYTPPAKSSAPAWIWLVAGIIIGCFVMFLMKLEPKQDIRPGQTTTTTRPKEHRTDKPKFEFPQILSGNEKPAIIAVPLTEQQRNQLDGQRAAALLEGKPALIIPPVQPSTSTPVVQSTVTPANTQSQVAVITAPPKMAFFLQIGSYPTKNGAESIRAQLLMLGQTAKLETVATNGKTWYRVIVGSFSNKETATKTQSQLASQGFKQTLIIPRKIN